jgi:ClpP class serine protease
MLKRKDIVWAAPKQWAALITSEPVTGRAYAERPVKYFDGVAVIDISGVLLRDEDDFCECLGGASSVRISRQLAEAVSSPAVKSILLFINSPGGQVNGTAELSDQIYAVRRVKPVHAYVAGDCFSAGYWLASQAQIITMHEASGAGALGVCYPITDDYTQWIVSESTPNKYPETSTDASRAQMQIFLNDLAAIFMQHVARGRGVDAATVAEKFGQGDIFIAGEAVRRGMADVVGTFESALQSAKEAAAETSAENVIIDENKIGENQMATKQTPTAEMVDTADLTVDWIKTNLPELYDQILTEGAEQEAQRQAEIDAMTPADEEEKMAIAAARKDRKITAAKLAFNLRIAAQAKAQARINAEREARERDSAAVNVPASPDASIALSAEEIAAKAWNDKVIAAMRKKRGLA